VLPSHVRLVIVGEGEERAAILAEADRLGMGDRLVMAGFLSHPERFMGLFDIFALSSDSEQFPIALIEAMAAGLPAVSTDVGDVRAMLPAVCQDFIVSPADEDGFSAALAALVSDPALRTVLGAANQARAVEQFDEQAMISRYAALYGVDRG
jgi:glycosyltransferase involved in cell wall biosynthesis